MLTKLSTGFLKYGFLIYGSFYLLIYVTFVDSSYRDFCKLNTLAFMKLYCLITFICCIEELLLTQVFKFYCYRVGLHSFFKYAQINHLLCWMMEEVSFKT